MTDRFVAILMGSDSDLSVMQAAIDVLDAFNISREKFFLLYVCGCHDDSCVGGPTCVV